MRNRSFLLHGSFILILIGLLALQPFLLIARVEEHSMEPQLQDGQYILVQRGNRRLKGGEILVFHSPEERTLLVKRCILLPGDKVEVDGAFLRTPFKDYYLSRSQAAFLSSQPEVPPGHCLVLGDNQFHSRDSRDFGFVKVEEILGKVWVPNE